MQLGGHPDASFRPVRMPNPSRQNNPQYQHGTFMHYPTLVVEIAGTPRLRSVDRKYFNVNTSVQTWLDINIDLAQNSIWAGWGRRAHVGNGLRLVEQVEGTQGNATFLPIYPWPATSVRGQFSIISTLILHPNPVPPAISKNLVVTLEEIWCWS